MNLQQIFVLFVDQNLTKEKVWDSETFVPQQQNGRYVSASYVARFRPYRYTLHYEANGGAGKMDDQIFQHGQILPLNDCTYSREGYDFMGWSMSAFASSSPTNSWVFGSK